MLGMCTELAHVARMRRDGMRIEPALGAPLQQPTYNGDDIVDDSGKEKQRLRHCITSIGLTQRTPADQILVFLTHCIEIETIPKMAMRFLFLKKTEVQLISTTVTGFGRTRLFAVTYGSFFRGKDSALRVQFQNQDARIYAFLFRHLLCVS